VKIHADEKTIVVPINASHTRPPATAGGIVAGGGQ